MSNQSSVLDARPCTHTRMRALIAGLVLALFIAVPSAQAAGDDFGSPGLYLGGGVALGFENFGAGNVDFNTGTGLDFWLGLRLARFLALEGQVQWIPGIAPSAAPSIDARPLVYTANAKGYIPLGRFQPFGLVGVGGITTTPESGSIVPNRTDFVAKFGAGLDFYITKNLAAVASWNYVLPTGDLSGSDFNTLTFGAQLSF